ncbi:hypothetical protein PULV_a0282 [Pseudoalteromonas ulvae UL12]|uniref:Uncharacterized protein n=1 Tax=Pseudoalteromonas ulvae TaxID=107327 RepID=A0A244CUS3_PSEDV|nr:hypothetical protein [Pseudoalteromonas ulvae]MBE0362732.1 hypothetical protein [Pseudoalteromonas ulvae UL12]OUL59324.1 hypothetical protein B1199_03395 [Pseudoalteromonas ulvae]
MNPDIPRVSPTERDALLCTVKADFEQYQGSLIEGDKHGNGQKLKLFVMANVTTFHLIHNSSTAQEIDQFCKQYSWFYPLFATIKELFDDSEND